MAGGPLAALVPCLDCIEAGTLTLAERGYEGLENDEYRCEKGHTFLMDWSKGQATERMWPPSAEMQMLAKSKLTKKG